MASIISAGTTSNTALNLSADTTGVLQFQTNGTTPAMTITTGQLVGIGTSSPSYKLQVAGGDLQVNRAGTTTLALVDVNNAYGTIRMAMDAAGVGYLGIPSPSLPLAIYTANTERMRITSAGDVGIGTTSNLGSSKLDVRGRIRTGSGNSSGDAEIIWSNYASATTAWTAGVRQDVGGANNDLKFLRFDSSGTYQGIAMQITSGGNVGIGLSSPTYRLQVAPGTYSDQLAVFNEAGTWTSNGGVVIADYYDNTTLIGGIKISASTATSGFLTFHTGGTTERMRITSDGNLLVGTTSAFAGTNLQLSIVGPTTTRGTLNLGCTTNQASGTAGSVAGYNGTTYTAGFDFSIIGTSSGQISTFTNNAGSVTSGPYVAAGGTSWTSSSDETLKDIIEPITNATEKLLTLRTVVGKYKQDPTESRKLFLIAQDVDKVFPEVVVIGNDDKLGLNYQELIPVLVASIKEQQAMIEELKTRIETLEAK